jgi:formiminotetrahydrofolate cyclodeaminase
MKIADMKVTELINEVGAGTPAPGGGAVAGADDDGQRPDARQEGL